MRRLGGASLLCLCLVVIALPHVHACTRPLLMCGATAPTLTFDSLNRFCRLQAVMPRFGGVAALTNYLHRLDEDYDGYAQPLWASGIRRSEQLANATVEQLQAAGINNPLHASHIKARSGMIQAQVACHPSCRSV
eukprot:GHUV01035297.1.p2 GENE.GHUV01035297.1~~GHUV01035297.1.p2  ORF type:complete len:135 (+),score=23.76 GHUV01035297.1:89-493(+)